VRTLIIDDDADSARLMRVQLEKAGHTVEVALGGQTGIEAVGRDKPDLIILDLRMQPMDGYEVMRRLLDDEATRDIPVLVVSVVEAGPQVAEMGARGFVLKPFEAGGVAEAAAGILGL
jgi:two-component system alkaline phosphatase synthesis response regulator PhoP